MVNLSSNNSNNINLSGQTQRNVNISTLNTNNVDANTMGNSQRARSWAIGEGLIDGEDYSAKHYAQLAKVSEDIASGAIADIGTAKDGAILEIESETANKIVEINSTASSFEADLTLLTQRAETAATDAQASADYIVNNAPEATIQQTSTGAIITTKDLTHGITTATILNGAKGDKGDTGERGETGATGTSVTGVNLLSTVGKINTYRMNFSNGTYFDYDVTDGADGGVTIDQTFDGTSANAQSGVAIENELSTNYVKTVVGNYHIMNNDSDIQMGYANDYDNPTKAGVIGISEQQGIVIGVLDGETDPANPKMFATAVTADGLVLTNGITQQNAILTVSNNNLAVNGTEVQPLLVSGTNIKTINNNSLLGSGDITINEPILYSTTGQNTDGAMTQKAVSDELDSKIDLDYSNADYQPVNKSGDTMTGTLLIDGNYGRYQVNDILPTSTPSTNTYIPGLEIKNNNKRTGLVNIGYLTNGSTITRLHHERDINDTTVYSQLNVGVDKAGNAFCNFPNTICVDGQWIKKDQTIMNDVNIHGTTVLTYTLSLPNDGRNYEVLLSGNIVTGTTSGNALVLQVSSSIVGSTIICWTTNRGTTGASARSGGNVIIPVSSNHNIYVTRANDYTGTASLVMRGYRRIGTNS